jgi:serine protein kinase
MGVLSNLKKSYQDAPKAMSVEEYLKACKKDDKYYKSAAQRMLDAIGEPKVIDTSKDEKMGRIFGNRIIKVYPAFSEFYGMENTIDKIVNYFKYAAQGLEAKKQILYLMGPVGGGKSSLAEKLKSLIQEQPIYVLRATYENEIGETITEFSPVYESPLGLLSSMKDEASKEFGIPKRYFPSCPSPWALKRLKDFDGDMSKFEVVELYPSIQKQIGVSSTEPGDDNNQDTTALIGSTNISKLGDFDESDTDAYSYDGGLCRGNRGVMEFIEMFKANIKVLNPLLTATQEGRFEASKPIGAIPFDGIILAHSNESEWEKFQNDKRNEAFLDRIYQVRVPYSLRRTEEIKIYEKMLRDSELGDMPCAPKTLELLAEFAVMSRLKEPENTRDLYSKMLVYDGHTLKAEGGSAKSLTEYRKYAGIREGMTGVSTRLMFKVLSETFNRDQTGEVAANPVHLLAVLRDTIKNNEYDRDTEDHYINTIVNKITEKYKDFIGDEINKAYVDSYSSYGQNIFDNYITYAIHYLDEKDYRDPDTGALWDLDMLDDELVKIEGPGNIRNTQDFRNEVVRFALMARNQNDGENPKWTEYEPFKRIIEKELFAKTEDLLPVISFKGAKKSDEDEKKHHAFVEKMRNNGYTDRQIRILVDWYMMVRKNS